MKTPTAAAATATPADKLVHQVLSLKAKAVAAGIVKKNTSKKRHEHEHVCSLGRQSENDCLAAAAASPFSLLSCSDDSNDTDTDAQVVTCGSGSEICFKYTSLLLLLVPRFGAELQGSAAVAAAADRERPTKRVT